VSPAQIKDKLYSMPVYSGASGSIKFTKEGSSPQPERVFKVKGSRFELAQ